MCHDLFLEDGVYVKRRGISRAVINVVPQMSRLPHHTQTVFCLLSKYQQEGRAEKLKKGESKFLVEHVQVSAVGFCPQRPYAHMHARTYTQFRQMWILVYTLTEKHTHAKGSLSLLDTHSNTRTHAQ